MVDAVRAVLEGHGSGGPVAADSPLRIRGSIPEVKEQKPLELRRRYATFFNNRDAIYELIKESPVEGWDADFCLTSWTISVFPTAKKTREDPEIVCTVTPSCAVEWGPGVARLETTRHALSRRAQAVRTAKR